MLLEIRNVPIFEWNYGGDASFGVSYIWILLPKNQQDFDGLR